MQKVNTNTTIDSRKLWFFHDSILETQQTTTRLAHPTTSHLTLVSAIQHVKIFNMHYFPGGTWVSLSRNATISKIITISSPYIFLRIRGKKREYLHLDSYQIRLYWERGRGNMESSIDILIVGAGVSGLTAAVALHRQGFKSMVLESSNSMRASGFHLSFWTNAWKAFEEIGVADKLRQQHEKIPEMIFASMVSGLPTSLTSLETKASNCNHEVRRVLRRDLLGALEKELPSGTIRYSSKVVSIEESGNYKLVHLADGKTLKAKVLIGCDGVNSVVAKWLGFKKPALDGRSEIKGISYFDDGHSLGLSFQQFFGKGVNFGVMPGDDKCIYWFFTFTQTKKDGPIEENRAKMKQFVLRNIGRVPKQIVNVIENTKLEDIEMYPLTFRPPLEILWGNISKDNVCVTGDAWHPMTPDVGQGGGSAVEDGVTLARCLAEALSMTQTDGPLSSEQNEDGYERIRIGLSNYAKERRWRNFRLAVSAYLMAIIIDSEGMVLNFLRDRVLASYLAGLFLKRADFDCGKLKNRANQVKSETGEVKN